MLTCMIDFSKLSLLPESRYFSAKIVHLHFLINTLIICSFKNKTFHRQIVNKNQSYIGRIGFFVTYLANQFLYFIQSARSTIPYERNYVYNFDLI